MATPTVTPSVSKELFRKSGGDELAPTPEALDLEDKITPTDKVLVEEMVSALREEVKEMDRTKWLYEAQDPEVTMRVKV